MIQALLAFFIFALIFYKNAIFGWCRKFYLTAGRDFRAAVRFVYLNTNLIKYQRGNQTLPKIFTKLAAEKPTDVAFYFEDEIWTFREVDRYSNRIANYFKAQSFQRGDSVALYLENRPEYACIYLGLSKIGVVTALINCNLVNDPLLHSIRASGAKAVIYGAALKKAISDIADKLPDSKLFQLSEKNQTIELLPSSTDLTSNIENADATCPSQDIQEGNSKDKLMFIYTSGTTGLPKAAVITNMRYFFIALGLHYMAAIRKDDILYDPLPLYHTAGGVVGVGQCFLRGVTVVIRKKFSASNFWKDCAKFNCTMAQYIGEICRYIMLAHSNGEPVPAHKCRRILGNGLRPQIWKKFTEKFKVDEVLEFYGATEGNSNLINIDSKVGAVGFIPRYANSFYPVRLIRCDENTAEPIRNESGFCIPCKPGETGLLLGVVKQRTINEFAGYADKKASEKKLILDVFTKGDMYFNSGDVLVEDELGYFYFKDRTGDTFRWKGENVATSEVEAVISNVIDLSDAVVYGVEIPNTEGRAGMVAIVDPSQSLDMSKLCKGLRENLPSYAVPIFVRVMHSVPLTGTYKLKKTELQKEGFNIDKIKDKLYVYDARSKSYVELTQQGYTDIMEGKARL